MAIYSNGTSIADAATLDATVLTGALPAISGASLTGIPGPSTTKGDVGTYSMGFMAQTSGESGSPGGAGTMAGTDLRIRAHEINDMKTSDSFNNVYWNFSGTWKNMSSSTISAASTDTDMPNGLWLRVS